MLQYGKHCYMFLADDNTLEFIAATNKWGAWDKLIDEYELFEAKHFTFICKLY